MKKTHLLFGSDDDLRTTRRAFTEVVFLLKLSAECNWYLSLSLIVVVSASNLDDVAAVVEEVKRSPFIL